jgi:uncharacterized protein YigE (DUF2233 family)
MFSVGARALLIVTALAAGVARADNALAPNSWHTLEPGLELAAFASPQRAEIGDSLIRVLRIDPAHFDLRLLSAAAPDQGVRFSARQWCERNGLTAAINASMYQDDYRTAVSLMITKAFTNNARVSRDKAVLAFDRLDADVPPVQIIDRQLQDFEALRPRYGTLVQSIRMVSLARENVWQPQPTRWSTAAIGVDRQGRVLFIHVRSPYSTHDLINILLALPLDLRNAMYVEGGAEAQLFIASGTQRYEFIGMYDNGFLDAETSTQAWPVPNVIGVAKKKQ